MDTKGLLPLLSRPFVDPILLTRILEDIYHHRRTPESFRIGPDQMITGTIDPGEPKLPFLRA